MLDIDDLDNLATPESILLSAVCGEDAQDRSDRTILLPWVKFLWESYCQCLELLRVNTHCEILYHDIARKAFQFCLNYNRKMEFRKLSEKLRKHLDDIGKPLAPSTQVSITKPETQQLNLDTRLYQLDSAIQMELWQEAYKAIEDIHGLMTMSKKTPQPKTMANYYQKLAMVFWKADNRLFHAAALLRLLQLSRELKKTITPEELQRMASHVLVATLAIPLPSAHPEYDRFIETDKSPLEKAQRLAVLLGLSQPPSRASLLKDIIRTNVFQLALPDFQNLYKWLEVDYNPLNLCANVQNVINFIKQEQSGFFLQYTDALQDVTLVRLVRQVSQVYQTIEFIRFLELAKFADKFRLERILVDCVRHNDMQITIDHKQSMVLFGTDLSESQREDHADGPTLQSMPSEQVRQQLVSMSVVLHRAIAAINPTYSKADREAQKAQLVAYYHENKEREHQNILIRQQIIEDRKEFIERMNTEKEEEEYRRQEEIQRQHKIAEQRRLEQEAEERERKRQENELKQIKSRTMMEKMQQISQTTHGQKLLKIIEEKGTAVDPDEIAKEEQNALIRERKELQSRLKSQEKKIDYYERAKRVEEVPLIKEYLKEMAIKEEIFWDEQEKTRIENSIAERKNALQQQERLKRMHSDRDAYMDQLKAERKSLHVEKLAKFNEMLEIEKKKRLAQRIIERRKERRDKWLAEKEAERQRKLDEIRKEEEERMRIEREKRDKERAEVEEKLRKQSEIQRQRDLEMEEKERARKEKERDSNRERTEREKPAQEGWRGARETRDVREPRDTRDSREPRDTRDSREAPKDQQPSKDNVWRSRTVNEGEAKETGGKWRRDEKPRDDRKEGGNWRTSGDSNWRSQPGRDSKDNSGGGGSWRTVGESRDRPERDGKDNRERGERDQGRSDFRRDDRRDRDDRRGGERDDRRGDDRRIGDRDDRRGDDRRGGDRDRDDRRGGDRGGFKKTGDRRQDRSDRSERPKDDGGSWRSGN